MSKPGTRYWRRNLRIVTGLLVIWFVVSYGAGILWVEPLNDIQLGGFPLGFWFAHQGAILVFIALVFAYGVLMDREDARARADDDTAMRTSDEEAP